MSYDAKIIADSVGPNRARVTTFELTMPRIVLAEHNTHRMYSRNAASSRAIPVEKMLTPIEEAPMLPVWWGKNQSGMQAREELSDEVDNAILHVRSWSSPRSRAKDEWLRLRDVVVQGARNLLAIGLHKQIANRVVEPWMFTTVVCTATEWQNGFALRVDPAAQPEYERVMRMALEAYGRSVPRMLDSGQWHLPYVSDDEVESAKGGQPRWNSLDLCLISAGRCAAVTHLNQGRRDCVEDIARANRILSAGHMSPFEHQCRAMTSEEWTHYGMRAAVAWVSNRVPVGNVWGFHQFRKELPNEHDYSKIKAVP